MHGRTLPDEPHRLRHRLGGYVEYAPPLRLAGYAEALWSHHTPADADVAPGARHRVVPDPSLGVAFTCRRDEIGRPVDPRLIVVGPVTAPRAFPLAPGFEMTAVKLKLEWVEPLMEIVPGDHRNGLDDLIPLVPAFATPLLDTLSRTGTAEDAMAVLVAAIEGVVQRAPVGHARLARRALDLVRRSAGRVTVARLAASLDTSERQLRRVVQRAGGVRLKQYARTVRFLAAVTAADGQAAPSWARLAADTGFYDQAHLINEVRALSGLPPDRLHRERRAESEFSNPV